MVFLGGVVMKSKRGFIAVVVLAVTSAAWAGYVDTDNYYVMSTLELFQFDGAVSGSVTMEWNGAGCTLADITGAEQWWMQFGVTGDTGVSHPVCPAAGR
jgi:hypothetical protein